MIVLDASVLIAHLDADDAHHHRVNGLLTIRPWGDLVATVITIAEVLVGPSRAGVAGSALAALHTLDVRTLDIAPDAAADLALLRARTGLKLPDCCVLLAAERASCPMATFDDRLARVAADRGTVVAGY